MVKIMGDMITINDSNEIIKSKTELINLQGDWIRFIDYQDLLKELHIAKFKIDEMKQDIKKLVKTW